MIFLPTVEAKKLKLETEICTALRNGFIATFGDSPTPQTYEMACRFGNEAGKEIADKIVEFIQTMVVNVPAAPQASLVCAAGPVSGTVMIPDNMIMIG